MGNRIGTSSSSQLSQFGELIADYLKLRELTLQQFAVKIELQPATLSRYLRFHRKPPKEVVEQMIKALKLRGQEAERVRDSVRQEIRKRAHRSLQGEDRFRNRRLMNKFADYDLRALLRVLLDLGWHVELQDEREDFSCDMKVMVDMDSSEFVAINFPHPERAKPEVLQRGTGAMAGAYPELRVTLFYEGVAGGLGYYVSPNRSDELPLEADVAESTDAWLSQATEEKGRIVHGGNVVRVLAEYLEPNERVSAYLKVY